jgi:uncharacterized protein
MSRPCICRQIQICPKRAHFVPKGSNPQDLEVVTLTLDEWEALRLTDLEGLYQEQAAANMNISRQTLGNIVSSAHRKIADFLIHGKSLKIDGGNVEMVKRLFTCAECSHEWEVACGTGRPMECPACQSVNLHRSAVDRGGPGRGRCGQGFGRCQRRRMGRVSA